MYTARNLNTDTDTCSESYREKNDVFSFKDERIKSEEIVSWCGRSAEGTLHIGFARTLARGVADFVGSTPQVAVTWGTAGTDVVVPGLWRGKK